MSLADSIRQNLRRIRSIAPAASDLLDSVESQVSMMDAARGDAEAQSQTYQEKEADLKKRIADYEKQLKKP